MAREGVASEDGRKHQEEVRLLAVRGTCASDTRMGLSCLLLLVYGNPVSGQG